MTTLFHLDNHVRREHHRDGAIEYTSARGFQIAIARKDEDGEYRLTHVSMHRNEWAMVARLSCITAMDLLVQTLEADMRAIDTSPATC